MSPMAREDDGDVVGETTPTEVAAVAPVAPPNVEVKGTQIIEVETGPTRQ